RITFISLVNAGLGWITYLTGRSAVLNYIVLWIVPMGVTLGLILVRQWRQHGDLPPGQVACDRRPGLLGRLTLFPLNQHVHIAKHADPQTPWFDLKR
ncbi:MAG: fatty acid desaturase, partial [Zavarzinella sp.]|nr:fatty acid desaturase [Zavarzinella sp.]